MMSASEISETAHFINQDLNALEKIIRDNDTNLFEESVTSTSQYTIAAILGAISGLSILFFEHFFI